MGYKLICVDIDGTLLNGDHAISVLTKTALKKANDMGIHIAISTGRSFTDANYFADMLGVPASIIAANGAYVREKINNEIIYKNTLGEKSIWTIYDICMKYHITPCFHTPDKLIHGSDYNRFLELIKQKNIELNKTIFSTETQLLTSLEQWKKVVRLQKDNILKCEIFSEDVEAVKKIKHELSQIKELEVVGSIWAEHIEANSKGTSKGRSVEILASLLNIPRNEIMAIGDGENDITMIEFAGLGIAMGNATDMLKAKADYITATNDDDGVAKAFDKFIFV